MLIIGEEEFNKSATVNLETRLINLFLADNFDLFNTKQTKLLSTNDYYQKSYYNDIVLKDLWDDLKNNRHLVDQTIDFLENSDIYKISPFKSLSSSQLMLKEAVIETSREWLKDFEIDQGHAIYIIKGEAGVGKSVVLSSIYNEIQNISRNKKSKEDNLYKTNNYLLVNHNEMLKQYHHLAKHLKNLSKNHILKPTSFINDVDRGKHEIADVTLVDEAHLLLTSKDKYNSFDHQNQLTEIIKRSKITVLFFDPKQFLKLKSYWSESDLEPFKKQYRYKEFCLTEQFRINAGPSVINWIDDFVAEKIDAFPKIDEHGERYDFRIFDDGKAMFKAIEEKNKQFKLSRVVSTFERA
ncbi:DNA/RNA helicase domain-containing protein [Loigolactobacillus zhaoyuanensis]|uniref:DNA/RNA helicase domain-containing protein n=1 Tax=Loigolactobacillus zhaoyuanensis TaxID=2486017 RepID=A0ABW8UFG2_9LACO